MIKLLKHQISYNEFWALKDINFTLNKGDRLGILGLNGAGKEYAVKGYCRVLKATEGTVTAKGKIAPLLELKDLINSIQDVRIFIFMEQFLDSQRSS